MDAFLSKVRLAIDEGRCIIDTSKLKNKKTMAALGLRPEDVFEEVSTLTYEDYMYGPEPDNRSNHKGQDVWFFKKKVDWFMIYIKLEFQLIQGTQTDEELMVMSFHEDNIYLQLSLICCGIKKLPPNKEVRRWILGFV